MWLIVAVIAVIVCVVYSKYFKTLKKGNMVLVTGAVKSGKSTLSYYIARCTYRRNLRAVNVRNAFIKLFHLPVPYLEKPLFYTTIPVGIPHVLLTKELLLREERFAYKSVIWIDEASLFADSQSFKDKDVNDRLLMFNKLIAHETKGGTIVYNTQSVADLHYSIKRCISEIVYVYDTCTWLPFLLVSNVREERYSEDNIAVNTYGEDIADTMKRVVVPKRVWREFDCYCYSNLTDDLPVNENVVNATTLKAERVVSINDRHCIEKIKKEEEKCEKEI